MIDLDKKKRRKRFFRLSFIKVPQVTRNKNKFWKVHTLKCEPSVFLFSYCTQS